MWHLILFWTTEVAKPRPFLLPSASFCPWICSFSSCSPEERWLSTSYFSIAEFLSKTSVARIIALICQIPGIHLSIVCYSQISKSSGIWDCPPGFSAINIYNSIRTRFICWKHGAALIWVIFTSHYISIDQISWMWYELIKVARFTNWLYWNKNRFDSIHADQIS